MVGTRKLLRDRGYFVEGSPSFAYRRPDAKGLARNILVVDPEEAKIVRKVFALSISGYSVNRVSAALSVSRDLLKSILRNRFYVGEIENSKGEWIRGQHPAIIDLDTFMRAQAAIDGRTLGGPRPRDKTARTSTWILRDVATCALCGNRMSAAYAGRKTEGGDYERYYYVCSHRCRPGGNISVPEIEAATEPLLIARLEELREELAREPKPRKEPKAATDHAEKRGRLAKKRERFLEAFADGLMTRDELRGALTKVDEQLLKIDADEQASKKLSPLADPKVRRAILKEVGTIRRAWRSAKPEARREIVGHLVASVRMATGAEPKVHWRTPEELLVPTLRAP
jgi:hypothetical protein